MGYQESLIHIKPQRMFKTMIEAYAQAEKSGYYHCANVGPLSVITLKQQMFGYPPGTKLLWVCGDRSFHSEGGVFGQRICGNPFKPYSMTFIPAENLFSPEDEKLKGIDFDANVPSENAYVKRHSATNYAYLMQKRDAQTR